MLRKLPFVLLGLVTMCLIAATIVEKVAGTETAFHDIYLAPWMIALWTFTAVTALAEVLIRRRGMGFGLLLLHFSLVLILVGAAFTHFSGRQGRIELTAGTNPTDIWRLQDGEIARLPFTVCLADCGIDYHATTLAARDYYSILMIDGKQYRVSMNNVVNYRGYRFTQASIGEGSSTLYISHDPIGRGVSFGAYGLLFLSMILILLRGRRFHALARKVMAAIVLILLPLQVVSQPKTLQRPLARSYGELLVVAGDRVSPCQTLAKDFCNKIYGKDSYKGLTSEQVLTGWIYYYDQWKHEPMIRLKSKEARHLMGKEYVALTDLFTRDGYLLEPLQGSPEVSSDLIADDEKVTFISVVVAGKIPALVRGDEFEIIRLREEIDSSIASGHYNRANDRLKELRLAQLRIGGEGIPSDFIIRSELLYNNIFYPLLAAIVAFIGGGAGIFRLRKTACFICCAVMAYLTLVIALRWIVGGHIPLATGFETMLVLAWLGSVFALISARKIQVLLPAGLLVTGASLIVAMIGSRNPAVSPLVPVLASRLLSLHVMLVMSSYSLFAIIALNSIAGLAGYGATDVSRFLLYPAVFLLTAGIFAGAIWADRSWGRYWGWDPKETWALVTLFIYAFPLHSDNFMIFTRDRILEFYLLLAFLSVLMTYFGVNYLLSGLHSYGMD